jgi:hypothetical protein
MICPDSTRVGNLGIAKCNLCEVVSLLPRERGLLCAYLESCHMDCCPVLWINEETNVVPRHTVSYHMARIEVQGEQTLQTTCLKIVVGTISPVFQGAIGIVIRLSQKALL